MILRVWDEAGGFSEEVHELPPEVKTIDQANRWLNKKLGDKGALTEVWTLPDGGVGEGFFGRNLVYVIAIGSTSEVARGHLTQIGLVPPLDLSETETEKWYGDHEEPTTEDLTRLLGVQPD